MKNPNYKIKAFTHWMNLTFLFLMFAAWLFGLPFLAAFAITILVQAGVLWIAPDTEAFQRYVKEVSREDSIEDKRWYYLNQLWGIQRPAFNPLNMVLDQEINWRNYAPHAYDGYSYRTEYLRLLEIRSKLIQLSKDRPDVVSHASILEVENNINSWLELRVAAQDAGESLKGLNKKELMGNLKKLWKKSKTLEDPTMRHILGQKAILTKKVLDQIPRLTRRSQRSEAQAGLIQEHLEAYLTQAQTARNSGAAVHLGTLADLSADSYDEDALLEINSELGNFDMSGDDPIWGMLADEFEFEEENVEVAEVMEVSA